MKWQHAALFSSLRLCFLHGPALNPILYPNAHLQEVGRDAAKQDIAECRERGEAAGAKPGEGKAGKVAGSRAVGVGVAGGAIYGAAGRVSAIGAASGATIGLLRGLFSRPKPGQEYINFDHSPVALGT